MYHEEEMKRKIRGMYTVKEIAKKSCLERSKRSTDRWRDRTRQKRWTMPGRRIKTSR